MVSLSGVWSTQKAAWDIDKKRGGRAFAAMERLSELLGVTAVREQATATDGRVHDLSGDIDRLTRELNRRALHEQIIAVSAWIRMTEVASDSLISVIMPTHNRADYLERAIRSVEGQSYNNWELIVVDDGSLDDTPRMLNSICSTRIEVVRIPQSGQARARNQGLAMARGDIVTYLDDDNMMHPDWLKAVSWAFDYWPETEVLYGARIYENSDGWLPGLAAPTIHFEMFDRNELQLGNFVDTGVIAHNAHADEAWWVNDLETMEDWEFFARLVARRDPLVLPTIASFYRTSAAGRVTDRAVVTDHVDDLRLFHGAPESRVS